MQQKTRWLLTGIVVVLIAVAGIVVLNVRNSPAPDRVDAQSQAAAAPLPGDSAPPGKWFARAVDGSTPFPTVT